ncbi:hypothetical protein MGYG_08912 [Nannizzia gypsea CBS 118893]|uniref:Uncharacterized protein n=1 Tax=Arthroderma gypseum (strain ATCC MYA-4604 / CBS 118893) TaxID=535722 RepID=E5R3C3_ARTGP|nr:hypothetical protein MGYG_08912 [Nannizzia gypsea CBS 118893]EFQ97938.1 hypothetical protein MGYG_08912 [Nannizzia gypsea CBS 118893]
MGVTTVKADSDFKSLKPPSLPGWTASQGAVIYEQITATGLTVRYTMPFDSEHFTSPFSPVEAPKLDDVPAGRRGPADFKWEQLRDETWLDKSIEYAKQHLEDEDGDEEANGREGKQRIKKKKTKPDI